MCLNARLFYVLKSKHCWMFPTEGRIFSLPNTKKLNNVQTLARMLIFKFNRKSTCFVLVVKQRWNTLKLSLRAFDFNIVHRVFCTKHNYVFWVKAFGTEKLLLFAWKVTSWVETNSLNNKWAIFYFLFYFSKKFAFIAKRIIGEWFLLCWHIDFLYIHIIFGENAICEKWTSFVLGVAFLFTDSFVAFRNWNLSNKDPAYGE